MKEQNRFLTAQWSNLVMLNYAIDRVLLDPFVPRGTELDSFEGKIWLSLVGFEFNRTRLHGIRVPFHQSFEEVNLRFYVRRSAKRGVVFIRELVPKRAAAAVARFAFGENYSHVPMSHRLEHRADGALTAEYAWGRGAGRCAMQIQTEGDAFLPAEGSASQFITEHYWGYAAQPGGGCLEYEVRHPRWLVRTAKNAAFIGNPADVYGAGLAKALARKSDSAFLAEGSDVIVMRGAEIG